MKKLLLILPLGFLLGACDLLQEGRGYAGEGTAYAVISECSLSASQRRQNLDAINDSLAEQGRPERAVALDCDGDGAPDEL